MRSNAIKGKVEEHGHPEIYDTKVYLTSDKTCPPAPAIDAAADLLTKAQKPVIVSGNGVHIARASDALKDLAERLGAPVVTSYLGKTISRDSSACRGPIGYTGVPLANEIVGLADVVLVIGSG